MNNLNSSTDVNDIYAQRDIRINNMPAKQFELEANIDTYEIYYLYTVIKSKKNFYQIIAWTLSKYKVKYKKIMEKMSNSLIEL